MAVHTCHLCDENPAEKRLYGEHGLAEGEICPTCYQPTCRYHLTVVRWRWRSTGEVDSALICKSCKSSYAHRSWDAVNRDWIT
ncbi:MAG: hypothetical protein Kow0080_17920 [Candidatus Promineifilaceae bacterium]